MYLSVFMGPAAMTPLQDGPLIDQCLALAQQSAEAGFAMVTFGEQHFNSYEPYSNPFLMAARLSPVLGQTWFGTTIVPLPFQHVLRLAEDSSVVDVLTKGRLIMGMSAGRVGLGNDFVNFGLDETRREEIFDAKLALLRRAYTQKPGDPALILNTEWDHGRLTGRMMPVPFRDGGPQLAIGTNTDATIGKVANLGLALFLGPCPLPAAAAKLRSHREALKAAGFSQAHIDDVSAKSLVTRYVILASTDEQAWEAAEQMCGRGPMMDRSVDKRSLRELSRVPVTEIGSDPYPRNVAFVHGWMSVGTPDSVTAQLQEYADEGVRQVNTRFTVGTYNPQLVQRSFDMFVAHVMPALNPQLFGGPRPEQISPEHQAGNDVMAKADQEWFLASHSPPASTLAPLTTPSPSVSAGTATRS